VVEASANVRRREAARSRLPPPRGRGACAETNRRSRPPHPHLLLIPLHDIGVPNARGLRVEAGLTESPPLAKQVPALIE